MTIKEYLSAAVAIITIFWALIKYILSDHKKKIDKHLEDYSDFKEKQIKENEKNINFRHKFGDFDKVVARLIDDTEKSLIERFKQTVDPMARNIEFILQHLIKSKNDK